MNFDANVPEVAFTQADLANKIDQLLKKWTPS